MNRAHVNLKVFIDGLLFSIGRMNVLDIIKIMSAVAVLFLVLDVYIKAFFGIGPGSVGALYKDILIFTLLLLWICFYLLKPRILIKNTIDKWFLLFILFGVFEVIWTYLVAGNLFNAIFRFRIYFTAYFVYFPLVYIMRGCEERSKYLLNFVRFLFLVAFVWGVLEFLIINLNIVPVSVIDDFINIATGADTGVVSYGSLLVEDHTLDRGYGIVAHIINAGVFYVCGLAAFGTLIFEKENYSNKNILFFILGLFAITFSLGKTAWLLLIFVIFSWFVIIKKQRLILGFFLSFFCLIVVGLYIFSQTFRFSIGSTFFVILENYIPALESFFKSSWLIYLFGFGYEIHTGEIEAFDLKGVSDDTLTVGSEVFFISILKQWGVVGLIVYMFVFVFWPYRVFLKSKDLLIKGIALAVVVIGLSSIHYNAIFRSGFNIINCFLLAYLSVTHFDGLEMDKVSGRRIHD